MRAGLLTFQPEEPGDPPPEEPTGSTPTTFELADEGGKWLFNSPEYLQPMIDSLRASEEEQQGQQGSGGGDSGSGDSEQK